MTYGSRKPTSDIPEEDPPENNPWGTEDDFFHLLNLSAVRCCHCRCVVGKEHVTVVDGHVFCPDHKESDCTTCDKRSVYRFNVRRFIEHNNL